MVERTFVAIKPEAIQRHLVGEIIKRFEQRGLKLIACKLLIPAEDQLDKHYVGDKDYLESIGNKTLKAKKERGEEISVSDPLDIGKKVRGLLLDAISGRPILAMVWEGAHAIDIIRKVVGSTEPYSAMPGTIRGDFGVDSFTLADRSGRPTRNLVHASSSVADANKEIEIWFDKTELVDYPHVSETVMYTEDWGRHK